MENESEDPMYGEFKALLQRAMRKEITAREYCKMADDIIIAYTNIRWPLHLPESYARLPPSFSSSEDEDDVDTFFEKREKVRKALFKT